MHTVQVTVPDVHPGELVQQPGLLSMCAGDFVEVYSAQDQASSFDCVATCFFIDTAHNILEYMDIIHHILKVHCNALVHDADLASRSCQLMQYALGYALGYALLRCKAC